MLFSLLFGSIFFGVNLVIITSFFFNHLDNIKMKVVLLNVNYVGLWLLVQ